MKLAALEMTDKRVKAKALSFKGF